MGKKLVGREKMLVQTNLVQKHFGSKLLVQKTFWSKIVVKKMLVQTTLSVLIKFCPKNVCPKINCDPKEILVNKTVSKYKLWG